MEWMEGGGWRRRRRESEDRRAALTVRKNMGKTERDTDMILTVTERHLAHSWIYNTWRRLKVFVNSL